MVEETVWVAEMDELKIIDASHVKVHQDACHFPQSAEQQGFGKTKGDCNSKLSAVTNCNGKLVNLKLVPGNEADITSAVEVLGEVAAVDVTLRIDGDWVGRRRRCGVVYL